MAATLANHQPDLTREDPGVPSNLGVFAESDDAQGKHRGVIYSIAPSPKDVKLIWIGTDRWPGTGHA